MPTAREHVRLAPQRVDPLSWFTGPRIPLVVVIVLVAMALSTTIVHWRQWSNPWQELLALPFFGLSAYILSTATRPQRPPFGPALALLVLLIAGAGFMVSAAGAEGGSVTVESWWGPVAIALIVSALAPYSSALQMIAYALPPLLLVLVVTPIVYPPNESGHWAPVTVEVIAGSPTLAAGLAGAVFSYSVVSRMSRAMTQIDHDPEPAAAGAAIVSDFNPEIARFLEEIAARGTIRSSDRERATVLADSLRIELVTAANRSWLDTLALKSGLKVDDPQHLADRMNENQRSALRGLLVEVTESPVVPIESVLVEIRDEGDGSTAVALSMDVDLPEGRRVMLLAPHYLTLGTTVDDLSWDDGRTLLLKFRIPPQR